MRKFLTLLNYLPFVLAAYEIVRVGNVDRGYLLVIIGLLLHIGDRLERRRA